MVDCGSSRCAQEKRVFKKELLTWSKKIPLILGLEQIAEELIGKDSMDRLFEPFKDIEQPNTEDWEPQTTCQYCHSKNKFYHETSDSSFADTQELLHNDTDGEPCSQLLGSRPGCCNGGMLSLSDQDTENQPLDLSAHTPSPAMLTCGQRSPPPDAPSPKSAIELKVPHIVKSGKKKDFCGKKSYTEVELQAAVSEIRSGKIGTRRASVLYGIPRSTLRNKIFKLESSINSNGVASSEPAQKLTMVDLLQSNISQHHNNHHNNNNNLSNNLSALQAFYEEDTGSDEDDLFSRKLEQMRRKHNLSSSPEKLGLQNNNNSVNGLQPEGASTNNGIHSPYVHELKHPILPGIVRKLAQQRMQMERERSAESEQMPSASAMTPLDAHMNGAVAPVTPHHVELKIPSYKPMRVLNNGVSHADTPPSADTPVSSNGKIGDTLKDIIAKTIAEKVRSRAQANALNSYHNVARERNFNKSISYPDQHDGMGDDMDCLYIDTAAGAPSALQTNVENTNGPPPYKKIKPHPAKHSSFKLNRSMSQRDSADGKSENKPSMNNDGTKPPKKTRPKRGQYRRYNSQLLIEAVKAVQRGEMSVHRAGSYFGVPHSTLEYKVKERHLLRKKKIEEKKKAESVNDSISALSTSGNSNDSSVQGSTPSSQPVVGAIASHLNLPPANGTYFSSPILGATATEAASVMNSSPSYNPGFALNTSASELLKKLQQKVQAKAGIGEAFHE